MAVVSDIEVANWALSKMGEKPIESFTQDNPRARAINQVYQKIKRAELRRYRWSFAKRRASLAASPQQTSWGGLNKFPVPEKFIRLLRETEEVQRGGKDWNLESDDSDTLFIVTKDAAPLNIKYIRDVPPNLYDDLFVESLASKVGFETCEKITGSTNKKSALLKDYNTAIKEATRVKAIEQPPMEFPEDTWLDARY